VRILFVLLLALLSVACVIERRESAPSIPDGGCSSLEFRLAPDLDPRVSDAVMWSLDVWSRHLSGSMVYRTSIGVNESPYEACVISVRQNIDPGTEDYADSPTLRYADGKPGSGIVVFVINNLEQFNNINDPEFLKALALHELGHVVIGPGHDEDRAHKSVMWPVPTLPARLGCEDVRRACSIWHCPVACEGQAWIE
jgi:hypothetical protein